MKEDNGDRQEAIGGDGNGKRSARGDRMAMAIAAAWSGVG
jgi:hypothetical protein